ncbi:DUF1104 domain-containing protein [Helicobacter turcicus]|uniref:DUF1104 domain-containing protein n=1 Tax=Helicobacter turcicus TaxID=2867412 RepID=A0ABS7JMN7_9HELI|nr:DUF1104 domain-containing protein [Helicobacter turcicus]MBX7490652.1 DUF1104 domain-containing protein [Helicobacter turcicus]MBX7545440.1 DUF1104 domain-containing protein [Helicobacter turcicus]
MKSRMLVAVFLAGALSISAFGADFSKVSNEKLIEMSGTVAPKDYPDYKMEVFKRTQEMKVKDAKVFKTRLHEQRRNALEAMQLKERREYRDAIRAETQKRIDSMSVKEAREKGLLKDYHHPKRYDKDGYNRDCAPCPRK